MKAKSTQQGCSGQAIDGRSLWNGRHLPLARCPPACSCYAESLQGCSASSWQGRSLHGRTASARWTRTGPCAASCRQPSAGGGCAAALTPGARSWRSAGEGPRPAGRAAGVGWKGGVGRASGVGRAGGAAAWLIHGWGGDGGHGGVAWLEACRCRIVAGGAAWMPGALVTQVVLNCPPHVCPLPALT